MSTEVLSATAELTANAVPSTSAVITPAIVVVKPAVSDELVQRFCDAIIDGNDTKGILPARISDLAITDSQKDSIKAARKDREAFVKGEKKNIMKWLRHRRVETRSLKQRTNSRNGNETMHLRAVKPGIVKAKSKK